MRNAFIPLRVTSKRPVRLVSDFNIRKMFTNVRHSADRHACINLFLVPFSDAIEGSGSPKIGGLNHFSANVFATPTLDLDRQTTSYSHDSEFGGCMSGSYRREERQITRNDSIFTFLYCIPFLKPRAHYLQNLIVIHSNDILTTPLLLREFRAQGLGITHLTDRSGYLST